MTRTLEEINKEYSQAIAELGKAYYDMNVFCPDKIETLKVKIAALYQEAAALSREPK